MNDSLFNDIPEQLSPRLAWMREHNVSTGEIQFSKDTPWIAWVGELKSGPSGNFAEAATEDEAICALAKANSWRLWNEQ